MDHKLAIILIRGKIGMKHDAKKTAELLKLNKKHTCRVLNDTPEIRGMMQKLKDYATYGEINEETYVLLQEKKPKLKEKNIFHLNPPKKGFERKGIKKSFASGGALGYRKDKINDLIKKML